MRAKLAAFCLFALAFVGCADPPGSGQREPDSTGADAPSEVVLTCGEDGSTTLSSDAVRAQPDGVHLDVVNRYDEPVSVEGFDADPGRTTWVLTNGPGTMRLMCWPFSQHESGDEPGRLPLTIVDPDGLYVDGRIACEDKASMIGDYFEEPVDMAPPLDAARELIEGLRPDDELLYAGYPEQAQRSLVVVRDGEVVGAFSIARWEGGTWEILSYTVCADSGLPSAAGSGA